MQCPPREKRETRNRSPWFADQPARGATMCKPFRNHKVVKSVKESTTASPIFQRSCSDPRLCHCPKLVFKDPTVQPSDLVEIIFHPKLAQSFAHDFLLLLIQQPGSGAELLRDLIDLRQFPAKWMVRIRNRVENVGAVSNRGLGEAGWRWRHALDRSLPGQLNVCLFGMRRSPSRDGRRVESGRQSGRG